MQRVADALQSGDEERAAREARVAGYLAHVCCGWGSGVTASSR